MSATLPDGLSGTQSIGGNTVNCTAALPCTCSAANPCSVPVAAPYPVDNLPVTFTQAIGAVTSTCDGS